MKAPIKCPMFSEPFCIAYFEPFNIHYFHSHFLGSRGPESGLRITFLHCLFLIPNLDESNFDESKSLR